MKPRHQPIWPTPAPEAVAAGKARDHEAPPPDHHHLRMPTVTTPP